MPTNKKSDLRTVHQNLTEQIESLAAQEKNIHDQLILLQEKRHNTAVSIFIKEKLFKHPKMVWNIEAYDSRIFLTPSGGKLNPDLKKDLVGLFHWSHSFTIQNGVEVNYPHNYERDQDNLTFKFKNLKTMKLFVSKNNLNVKLSDSTAKEINGLKARLETLQCWR